MTDDFYSKPNHSAWDNNNVSSTFDSMGPRQSNFALMRSPNNYVVPDPKYNPQFRPPYNSDYRAVPSQPAQAPPADTVSAAEKSKSKSCTEHITVTQVIGLLGGLVVAAIPLAIMVTLYVQLSSASNNTTTSASGSGGAATTATTSLGLPAQCSSTLYTALNDATRLSTYQSCCTSDCSISTGWYRVTGASGTRLATTPPSTSSCSASYPMWYNGSLPTNTGSTTSGVACANVNGILCQSPYSMSPVLATNCGSYYVFYLIYTPYCGSSRYCTTY